MSNKHKRYTGEFKQQIVKEATFKVINAEFASNKIFENFEQLEYVFCDYLNWYNNHRIHGPLDYLSPVEYRLLMSDKKAS